MSDGDDIRIDAGHDDSSGGFHGGGFEGADEPVRLDDELELAYRQALEANEAVEEEIGPGIELDDWSGEEASEDEPAIPANADDAGAVDPSASPRVTPRQVIEAALFVGGDPLTAKKLGTLVGPDVDKGLVEEEISSLNELYAGEGRPYEVRLEEGGYRLQLREEFEPLRNRVFGLGPKEVRLSQEQLEVLSLVAYEQPISRQQIEDHGRTNAGGMLRQLLRRQLIRIERGHNSRRDITYRTTDRFLEVFNMVELEDLPSPQEIERR